MPKRTSEINEAKLINYLKRQALGGPPKNQQEEAKWEMPRKLPGKKRKPGRPRTHKKGAQRVYDGDMKITFIGTIEHAEAMKSAAHEQGITIKEAYSLAIDLWLSRFH